MKENVWIGYFPIPNNRNRERLIWEAKDKLFNLAGPMYEKFVEVLSCIEEKYLHECYLMYGNINYFSLVWLESNKLSKYGLEVRYLRDLKLNIDTRVISFCLHYRKKPNPFNIVIAEEVSRTDLDNISEGFIKSINNELETHYG